MKRILAAASLFVSGCAVFAQDPAPAFEVATIKQAAPMDKGMIRIGFGGDAGRINYSNVSLKDVIARAYNMKRFQVSGPSWLDSERYDITAKIPEGVPASKTPEMLQSLLAERFKMAVHKESREQSIYALVVGKGGPKLKKSDDNTDGGATMVAPNGARIQAPKGAMLMSSNGQLQANRATLGRFADMLSNLLDRPVLDMTEVAGEYDISLEMSMEDMVGLKKMAAGMGPGAMAHISGAGGGEGGPAPDSAPQASVFTAVQKLGLKLDPRKAPVDYLVVDRAEKVASEN